MSNKNQYSLKEAIQEMLKAYQLDGKLKEINLINSWEKIVGKMIANHTKDVYISNKKLFIKVDSDALRHELLYSREKIKNSMNEEAGEELIEEVILK